jgi:hypothetical protein
VWEGTETGDGRAVIVSLGPPVEDAGELELRAPGIAELLAVGEGPDGLAAVVEARPPGERAAPGPAGAAHLGAVLAGVVAGVHAEGVAAGGVRPEAVWADGESVVLTPRATRLWELGRADVGIVPAYPSVFASFERLTGAEPGPEDDVFAVAATVAVWATGKHPFEGDSHARQVLAIAGGERRPWGGAPALGRALLAALGPAAGRPSAAELAAALRALAGA